MAVRIATIPRVPVALEDAPAGEPFRLRGPGRGPGQLPAAAAIDRSTGAARLRMHLGDGHWIVFDHGTAVMFRPGLPRRFGDPDERHHIHWSPTPGLRFRYETYADQTKLAIVLDERHQSNVVTYQARLSPGLTYARDDQTDLWRIVDADGRELAWHPPLDIAAGPLRGTATLEVAQEGDLVTYQVTVSLDFWLRARALGVPIVIDPTTITTSTSATATAPGTNHPDRCIVVLPSSGKYVMGFRDGTDLKIRYSTDAGATWNTPAAGATISTMNKFALAADAADHLYVVYKSSADQDVRIRASTTTDPASITWTSDSLVRAGGTTDSLTNAMVVTHAEGVNWLAHVVIGRDESDTLEYTFAYHYPVTFNGSTLSVGSVTEIYRSTAQGNPCWPSIDVDGSKNLRVGIHVESSNSGQGTRYQVGVYSAGTHTWDTATSTTAVLTGVGTDASGGIMSTVCDTDGNTYIALRTSASGYCIVKKIDTSKTVTTISPTTLAVNQVALGIDGSGNPVLVYTNGSGVHWRRYISAAWSGATTLSSAASAKYPSVARRLGGSLLPVAWMEGAGSPYNIQFDTINFNTTPTGATVAASPTNFPNASGTSITITHNDPDADNMAAYYLKRVKVSDATTDYFDDATNTWVVGETRNAITAAATYNIPAGDNDGTWTNNTEYDLYAKTEDTGGLTGPYGSAQRVKASAAPTNTITSPGASITTSTVLIEWTYAQTDSIAQKSYRARVYNSGRTVTHEDSGVITDTNARARQMTYTLVHGTTYEVGILCVSQDDVAATEVYQAFSVSLTAAPVPTIVVTADDANARVSIAITNTETSTTTEGDTMTLTGGAAAAGTDAVLDAQSEQAAFQVASLPTGTHKVTVHESATGAIADDLRVVIYNVTDASTVSTTDFTTSVAPTTHEVQWSATAGKTYEIRISKATATANTITVDKAVVANVTAADHNVLDRSVDGETTWSRVEDENGNDVEVATGGTAYDYLARSGVQTYYRARSVTAAGVESNPSTSGNATPALTGWWLHVWGSESTYKFNITEDVEPVDLTPPERAGVVETFGIYPVVFPGQAAYQTIGLIFMIGDHDAASTARSQANTLAALVARDAKVIVRGWRGDAFIGYVRDPRQALRRLWKLDRQITLTVIEIEAYPA